MMIKNAPKISMSIDFTRFSLVRITLVQRYHVITLVFSGIFMFQILFYYLLAHLARLYLYAWDPQRIDHSHVNSIKIHQSMASIGSKIVATRHSILAVWDQLNLL
jgi:hypothetical protein